MKSRTYRPAIAVAVLSMLAGCASAAAAQAPATQAPATQAPMNMATMDHRGGIRGTVRGANGAPVADTAVTAVNTVNGARCRRDPDWHNHGRVHCLFAISEDVRTRWPQRFGARRPAGLAGGQ